MYDIHFLETSQDIKKNIASGVYRDASASFVAKILDSCRSTKPYVFNVEITNACNMRCIMCPRTQKMTRPLQRLRGDDFEAVLDQITPYNENQLQHFISFAKSEFGIGLDEKSEDAFYFHHISRCLTLHGYGESLIDPAIVERVESCSNRNIPTYFSCVSANISFPKMTRLMDAGLDVLKFSIDSLDDKDQKSIRGPANNFKEAFQK